MNFQEATKKYAVNKNTNAGVAVGESFASITGESPKAFFSAHGDDVSLGGKKINIQGQPGQIKVFGGFFHFSPFPLCFFPSTMFTPFPMVQFDPEIIITAISLAVSVVDIFSILG